MKIISAKTSERVCKHMNNDHVESVHKYLKYYGKISEDEIHETLVSMIREIE